MPTKEPEIPRWLSWYAIEQMRGWLAANPNQTATDLSKVMLMSKPTAINALKPGASVGERAAMRVAEHVAHVQWEQFKKAALEAYKKAKPGETVLVRDDRYPSRPQAVEFVRGTHITQAAIDRVLAIPLQSPSDPGRLYWVRRLEEAQRDVELEAKQSPEQKAAVKADRRAQLKDHADEMGAGIDAEWNDKKPEPPAPPPPSLAAGKGKKKGKGR